MIMGFSWTPPPKGSKGTPISGPIINDEHAMMEYSAAAKNAGIDGYHPNMEAVREAASSGAVPDNTNDDVDVLIFDGTSVASVTDHVVADGPVVDIWTFGSHESRAEQVSSEEENSNLFDRLKKVLPKLSIKWPDVKR